jgi:hypothetical protein
MDYAGHPEDPMVSKLLSVRDRANDMQYELKEKSCNDWRAAWDGFLLNQDWSGDATKYYPELKTLLRMGVPLRDRGKVWSLIVHSKMQLDKQQSATKGRYYHKLLAAFRSQNRIDPVIKQVSGK